MFEVDRLKFEEVSYNDFLSMHVCSEHNLLTYKNSKLNPNLLTENEKKFFKAKDNQTRARLERIAESSPEEIQNTPEKFGFKISDYIILTYDPLKTYLENPAIELIFNYKTDSFFDSYILEKCNSNYSLYNVFRESKEVKIEFYKNLISTALDLNSEDIWSPINYTSLNICEMRIDFNYIEHAMQFVQDVLRALDNSIDNIVILPLYVESPYEYENFINSLENQKNECPFEVNEIRELEEEDREIFDYLYNENLKIRDYRIEFKNDLSPQILCGVVIDLYDIHDFIQIYEEKFGLPQNTI